jgi:hypothetical protein
MKVKILVRPSGAFNGEVWPEVGETMDLPETVAKGMAATGHVEIASAAAQKAAVEEEVEFRPAPEQAVETATPTHAPVRTAKDHAEATKKAVAKKADTAKGTQTHKA